MTEMNTKCILFLVAVLHRVASAPESVFALEGNSVILTMKRNDSLDNAVWIFNQSSDVVRYYPHYDVARQLRVSAPYKGRVEFDNTTLSLALKKLMKNDSGLYTGQINAVTGRTVVEYRLSIYELVSAPVLTVEPVASNGDLWNVSCRAGDLSLTFTCNSSTCTQEEMTALSRIIIFIEDGAIICNHSNPLSWRHATVTLWKRNQFSVSEFPSATKQRFEWILMTGAGGLGGLLICGVVYFRAQLKKQAGSLSSNIYQSVEILDKNQSEVVCVKNTQLLKSVEHPPTIYWKLQPHTSLNTDVTETPQPECIYEIVGAQALS